MDYEALIQRWDDLIKKGHFHSLFNERAKADLPLKSIPRKWRLPLSSIFRRSGIVMDGLKLMTPVVRGKFADEPATDADVLEYCRLLDLIGAGNEALSRLNSIDPEKNPEALIQRAQALFGQWDYRSAIPLIRKYLETENVGDYLKLVAKINLALALTYENQFEESGQLLDDCIQGCQNNELLRPLAKCKETQAQLYFFQNDAKNALKCIEDANEILISDVTIEKFFIQKWRAIVSASQSGDVSQIEEAKKQALERQHWETVRDLDLFIASFSKDQSLSTKLYHGTPFEGFRRRVKKLAPEPLAEYHIGGAKEKVVDAFLGHPESKFAFDHGKSCQKLFNTLIADFYQPVRLGHIFSSLYPDENFDYLTSNNRVHQSILRTRRLLKKGDIDIDLSEADGLYKLTPGDGICIRKQDYPEVTPLNVLKHLLQSQFAGSEFSSSQAGDVLGMKSSNTSQALKDLVDAGELNKTGKARNTRFHFSSRDQTQN